MNRYIKHTQYNEILSEIKSDLSVVSKKYRIAVNDDGVVYDKVSKITYTSIIEWLDSVA